MRSVAELLEKAAEYDRLATQALRLKEKAQNENLAACSGIWQSRQKC